MKIWISENLKKKDHYAAGILLPLLLCVVLTFCLIIGSIFAGFALDLPMEVFTFVVCIIATAFLIWAAAIRKSSFLILRSTSVCQRGL